ncbi:VOC family protein [Leucobacter luti]|nr:VOC family protein [Leucobacter luti]
MPAAGVPAAAAIPALLDHVVIAGPHLDALSAWFTAHTGVVPAPGGAHPTGTANALVALTVAGARGPQYIELIGPDPDRAGLELPTTFGIDRLAEPRVQAYAVHPPRIEAAVARARERGVDFGDVSALSRRTPDGALLEWRLTLGTVSGDGPAGRRCELPFLIDWGATPQPGETVVPSVELVSFVRLEPSAEAVAAVSAQLATLGLGDGVARVELDAAGASGFRLTLRTAGGELVTLGPARP